MIQIKKYDVDYKEILDLSPLVLDPDIDYKQLEILILNHNAFDIKYLQEKDGVHTVRANGETLRIGDEKLLSLLVDVYPINFIKNFKDAEKDLDDFLASVSSFYNNNGYCIVLHKDALSIFKKAFGAFSSSKLSEFVVRYIKRILSFTTNNERTQAFKRLMYNTIHTLMNTRINDTGLHFAFTAPYYNLPINLILLDYFYQSQLNPTHRLDTSVFNTRDRSSDLRIQLLRLLNDIGKYTTTAVTYAAVKTTFDAYITRFSLLSYLAYNTLERQNSTNGVIEINTTSYISTLWRRRDKLNAHLSDFLNQFENYTTQYVGKSEGLGFMETFIATQTSGICGSDITTTKNAITTDTPNIKVEFHKDRNPRIEGIEVNLENMKVIHLKDIASSIDEIENAINEVNDKREDMDELDLQMEVKRIQEAVKNTYQRLLEARRDLINYAEPKVEFNFIENKLIDLGIKASNILISEKDEMNPVYENYGLNIPSLDNTKYVYVPKWVYDYANGNKAYGEGKIINKIKKHAKKAVKKVADDIAGGVTDTLEKASLALSGPVELIRSEFGMDTYTKDELRDYERVMKDARVQKWRNRFQKKKEDDDFDKYSSKSSMSLARKEVYGDDEDGYEESVTIMRKLLSEGYSLDDLFTNVKVPCGKGENYHGVLGRMLYGTRVDRINNNINNGNIKPTTLNDMEKLESDILAYCEYYHTYPSMINTLEKLDSGMNKIHSIVRDMGKD